MKEKKNNKSTWKLIITIIKFTLFLIVLIGLPVYVFYNQRDLLQTFDSLESVNAFLENYQSASAVVYIGIQVLQIAIFIIPGQAIQLAAGYAFGFPVGFALTVGGIFLGTIVTFYLARILGKDAVHLLIGEEKTKEYIQRLSSKRALLVIFLIYLIPGIPKDAVTYIAGVSDIDIRPFVIISMLGRLPAMAGGVMIGSMLHTGSYMGVVLLSVFFVAAFIAGILFRDKLIGKRDLLYEKVVHGKDHPNRSK